MPCSGVVRLAGPGLVVRGGPDCGSVELGRDTHLVWALTVPEHGASDTCSLIACLILYIYIWGGGGGACAGGVWFSNSNRIIISDYRILLLLKMPIPNINSNVLLTADVVSRRMEPFLMLLRFWRKKKTSGKEALLCTGMRHFLSLLLS